MALQANTILIGVADVARSKKFYADGLGVTVVQDHPGFVLLNLGEGSAALALYPREAAAKDAGVPAEGSGFPGVSFHHVVESKEIVDEVIGQAVAAGGTVVKEPAGQQWGGYFGYFADPDGYLWKVVSNG